ncbi:MAG: hypothetical protein GYB68_14090, partial [Chloroflexi bacterium]|nr:hypothetical protein [Chloroflexota bacterium]
MTDPTGREPNLGSSHTQYPSEQDVRLGGEAALSHLLAYLDDPDNSVRERAYFGLAELGDQRGLDGLLNILRESGSTMQQRAIAADHLSRLRHPKGVQVVFDFIADGGNPAGTRSLLAAWVARQPNRVVLRALLNALDVPDPIEVWPIFTTLPTLAQFGAITPHVTDRLIWVLQCYPDRFSVVMVVLETLRHSGDRTAVPALCD